MQPQSPASAGPGDSTPAPAAAEPLVECGFEKPGVLLVDDDRLVRLMVSRWLAQKGFRVWSAADGYEAIRMFWDQRDHISVVLLEVRLPGLDGPETLEALRTINPDVAACFMSADGGLDAAGEPLTCDAALVLTKPFQLDHLVAALGRLVRSEPSPHHLKLVGTFEE